MNKHRIAVLWPRPRKNRWLNGKRDDEPDQSDALLSLSEFGFDITIEDSTPFPLNPFAKMHEMWSGLDIARSARMISRLNRYDLIVGVGAAVVRGLVEFKRLTGIKKPVVVIDPALSQSYPRRQKLQDRVLPYVDLVIVFGKNQQALLQQRYGSDVRTEMAYHRIDTDFYHEHERSVNGPFLSVGFDGSRDFETLVKAYGIVKNKIDSPPKCVVRTDKTLSPISGLEVVNERLTWPEYRQLFFRSRCFVLPLHNTVHAGGINSLLEAKSIGLPVICSRSEGVADYCNDADTLRVTANSSAELAEAMIQVIDSPQKAHEIGKKGREFVVQTCSNRVYAETLARLFLEILQVDS